MTDTVWQPGDPLYPRWPPLPEPDPAPPLVLPTREEIRQGVADHFRRLEALSPCTCGNHGEPPTLRPDDPDLHREAS